VKKSAALATGTTLRNFLVEDTSPKIVTALVNDFLSTIS